MKRKYGSEYTKLHLTGKALEAYNTLDGTIIEYTDFAYHVLPEYQHLWGEETTDDTIIFACEVARYAHDWDTTETDLLDQLEPVMMYEIPGRCDHIMTKDQLIKWLEDAIEEE